MCGAGWSRARFAISLLLLIGAGLFVRSLRNLQTLDPVFLRERVLMVNIDSGRSGYTSGGHDLPAELACGSRPPYAVRPQRGNPERLVAAIRREAANLDPAIPFLQTLSLEQQFDNNVSQKRVVTTLLGFFGVLALLVAAIGLYGVMVQSVARQVREIGIRMALGAQRGAILGLILRETALVVGIGPLVGLPAAFAATRLVASFLYGLTPQDPIAIIASTAVLLAITALAGHVPARRATKVDPMAAPR